MSMDSCEKHGWWEVNEQDACPSCEIILLRAEVSELKTTRELCDNTEAYNIALEEIRELKVERDEALVRLHELEKEPVITLPNGRNVSIGELVELYLDAQQAAKDMAKCIEGEQAAMRHGAQEVEDHLLPQLEGLFKERDTLQRQVQRAEAVVEAAYEDARFHLSNSVNAEGAIEWGCFCVLCKALAAWEEGKA